MRQGALIFLGGFFSLSLSWAALVLAPSLQLAGIAPHQDANTGVIHPVNRPGRARQGAEVYRSFGCNQCHTRFAVQENLLFGARITGGPTNVEPVLVALKAILPNLDEKATSDLLDGLPKQVILPGALFPAQRAVELLQKAETKAELTIHNIGADMERGWGVRRSVARDYLYDQNIVAGTMRIGPDLGNIGERNPSDFVGAWEFTASPTNVVERLAERRQWLLKHLYDPRINVSGSTMPPYPFLFEIRPAGAARDGVALDLPDNFSPGDGRVVIPKPEAIALVDWLLSQQSSLSLPEAPVPAPDKPAPVPAATNAAPVEAQAPAKQ